MPTLELSGTADDLGHIKAVMLYPDDPGVRLLYHAIHHHSVLLQDVPDDVSWRVSAGFLRKLIAGNPAAPNIVKTLSLRGIVAGELLATLYLMNRFKAYDPAFSHPSMNKAIHVMQMWSDKTSHTDGSNIPSARETITSCWNDYRSVAHLWAAQAITTHYPYVTPREEFADLDNMRKFLGVAAAFYEFGSTYTPHRSHTVGRHTLLDPLGAWIIPGDIPINRLFADDSTPPKGLLDVLATYKAPSIKRYD